MIISSQKHAFFGDLKDALHAVDQLRASDAARLIGEWGVRQLEDELVQYVESSRSYSKVTGIYALGSLRPEGWETVLGHVFSTPNVPDDFYWNGFKGVRTAAAVSLLEAGNHQGVEWLQSLAEANDPLITRWFAPALLRIEAARNLPQGLEVERLCPVEKMKAFDSPPFSEPGMLCMLCEALGLINNPAAGECLLFYTVFHSRFVRAQAYLALWRRNPEAGLLRRIECAASRGGTLFDLLVVGGIRQDIRLVKSMLESLDASFERVYAINLLARSDPRGAYPVLLKALKDADPWVRQAAVEGLGRIAPAEASSDLVDHYRAESHPQVRTAAAAILCRDVQSC